jgi:hypothetical protein
VLCRLYLLNRVWDQYANVPTRPDWYCPSSSSAMFYLIFFCEKIILLPDCLNLYSEMFELFLSFISNLQCFKNILAWEFRKAPWSSRWMYHKSELGTLVTVSAWFVECLSDSLQFSDAIDFRFNQPQYFQSITL